MNPIIVLKGGPQDGLKVEVPSCPLVHQVYARTECCQRVRLGSYARIKELDSNTMTWLYEWQGWDDD